ncbi:MAG: ABC transporter ATP-binding protein [Chloroflexi bacterium]|nr:ABC transporter ATP-binding protein [Chloroflexota bacterium]MCI0575008.1 ABC transporter ATP-binding protein [Chloroflexota bacterium]MCI0645764.1 ABC transporter ATP-binding protein [Chloroflexota bacterium]MCI0727691.1 ABC transporter ATP-binding protein [Chloroflexota bacterium]
MTTALRFDNVSKRYRLGAGQTNLREFLGRTTGRLLGRPGTKAAGNILWALRDVSFELPGGQALGLIGPNGAGKSTALKLLARITQPTSGWVATSGRVASLIELGAGFHMDLTGRENIYLNAAILGMPLKKVKRLFDQIVSFAGLEKFIDTPIKRYSSGMQVRLGFAVAAHVEPDILLVDEVLAVGDSQFRQRCIERIRELQEMGTTIVFVSHNLYMVKNVCDQGIFLANGRVHTQGDVVQAINAYEHWYHEEQSQSRARIVARNGEPGGSAVDITRVELCDLNGAKIEELNWSDPVEVRVSFQAHEPIPTPNLVLHFVRADGITSAMIRTADYGHQLEALAGAGAISVVVDPLQLTGGAYVVEARILGGMDVPLSQGHSQWFQVTGLGLSSRERGGVFVPRVGRIAVEG